MNRFSTATRLNSTRTNQHQEIAYHEALMNVLKGANITQSPEEFVQLESPSLIENSNYYQQQKQQQVQSDISRSLSSSSSASESTMRSKDYTDAPGELDMLIGFFLMNSVCIVFFLMFGMCVICSCMRRKPNFMKNSEKEPAAAPSKRRLLSPKSVSPKPSSAAVPPLPVTNPTFKPTFKAMISKAMKNEDFQKMAKTNNAVVGEQRRCSVTSPIFNETTHLLRRASEKPLKEETQIDMESPNNGLRCHSVTRQVQIQIEPTDIPSDKEMTSIEITPSPQMPSTHAICPTCHPIPPEADHICDCNCENEAPQQVEADETDEEAGASVIRQNLLGPLSFDDLYYT